MLECILFKKTKPFFFATSPLLLIILYTFLPLFSPPPSPSVFLSCSSKPISLFKEARTPYCLWPTKRAESLYFLISKIVPNLNLSTLAGHSSWRHVTPAPWHLSREQFTKFEAKLERSLLGSCACRSRWKPKHRTQNFFYCYLHLIFCFLYFRSPLFLRFEQSKSTKASDSYSATERHVSFRQSHEKRLFRMRLQRQVRAPCLHALWS